MNNRKMLLRGAMFLAAAVFLFMLFVYLLFPLERINNLVEGVLMPQGLKLSPAAHKTLLPGLAWDDVLLSSDQGALLRCGRLQARPLLLPLFKGQAVLSGSAAIGKGRLELNYRLNGRDAVDLDSEGINLSEIPFFRTVLGARVSGLFWSQGKLQRVAGGLSGDLKLEVRQLEYSGVKLGAFALPDAGGLKAQGMIRVNAGRARLESFTLAGDGIYMRLSGELPSSANAGVEPLNLTLEIMPKPEFMEKQKLVFMLLAKFMASPGVYKVPIRGTLLKPAII